MTRYCYSTVTWNVCTIQANATVNIKNGKGWRCNSWNHGATGESEEDAVLEFDP